MTKTISMAAIDMLCKSTLRDPEAKACEGCQSQIDALSKVMEVLPGLSELGKLNIGMGHTIASLYDANVEQQKTVSALLDGQLVAVDKLQALYAFLATVSELHQSASSIKVAGANWDNYLTSQEESPEDEELDALIEAANEITDQFELALSAVAQLIEIAPVAEEIRKQFALQKEYRSVADELVGDMGAPKEIGHIAALLLQVSGIKPTDLANVRNAVKQALNPDAEEQPAEAAAEATA